MDMKNRITYSAEEMLQSMELALEKLNILRYDSQYRLLLGDALIGRLATWDQNIRRRKKDPFTVVVIGDFKRGKSTFINALLGAEVVTTDVTTETVTFNRISYGASSNEAVLSGNRRLTLSDSELKREELERIIDQTGETVTAIELKRPIELLKDITIIDTPGTGDAMKDFAPQVEEYLLQADAVIYLYSLTYPLSRTEQLFLKTAVLPQQYTKLFLIGNYADTMENEKNYQRIRTAVQERIHGLLPDTEILTVSALDELCRQLNLERPCEALIPILEEQFGRFRDLLAELIADKRDTVLVDRMQRLTTAMLQELDEQLTLLEEGLAMDANEAKRRVENLQAEKQSSIEKQEAALGHIDRIVERMRGEANGWMTDFMERVRSETANLGTVSTDDLFKYYSFYCIDVMQQAMNTCIEYHTDQLFEELEQSSAQLAKDLTQHLKQESGHYFRFSLNNKVWTNGDNIGLAVSLVSTTGTLATLASLAADALTGALRQHEVEKKKPDVLKQIALQMRGLESSVLSTVSDLYTKLGDAAKKSIVEFYAEELEKAEYLVNQSYAVANYEEAQKDQIRAAAATARGILREAEELIAPH